MCFPKRQKQSVKLPSLNVKIKQFIQLSSKRIVSVVTMINGGYVTMEFHRMLMGITALKYPQPNHRKPISNARPYAKSSAISLLFTRLIIQ